MAKHRCVQTEIEGTIVRIQGGSVPLSAASLKALTSIVRALKLKYGKSGKTLEALDVTAPKPRTKPKKKAAP